MRPASGITRSQAPACNARSRSFGPSKFSPSCSGSSSARAISALPARSSWRIGSSSQATPSDCSARPRASASTRDKRLVVVDHEFDRVRQAGANRAGDREVFGQRGVAQSQFHGLHAAFEQSLRFIGGSLRAHQAQTAGVVGAHRPRRAAEQAGERHTGGNGQRVPQGHVERGQRHAHDAGHADQGEAALQLGRDGQRRDAVAAHQLDRVLAAPAAIDFGAAAPVAEHIRAAGRRPVRSALRPAAGARRARLPRWCPARSATALRRQCR